MKKFVVVFMLFIMALAPQTVKAQDINSVPPPPTYHLNLDYFFYLDYNKDLVYNDEDIPASTTRLDCLIGGTMYYFAAGFDGRFTYTIEVYEGDSYSCNFYKEDENGIFYYAWHQLINVAGDHTFDYDVPLQTPTDNETAYTYLPIILQ